MWFSIWRMSALWVTRDVELGFGGGWHKTVEIHSIYANFSSAMYQLERGVRLTGTDAWSWDAAFARTAQTQKYSF
jgi:hypothetical protein